MRGDRGLSSEGRAVGCGQILDTFRRESPDSLMSWTRDVRGRRGRIAFE